MKIDCIKNGVKLTSENDRDYRKLTEAKIENIFRIFNPETTFEKQYLDILLLDKFTIKRETFAGIIEVKILKEETLDAWEENYRDWKENFEYWKTFIKYS